MNNQQNIKRESRKEIERVYNRYSKLYAKMISQYSYLTDAERVSLIRKFELGLKISEYFYFYKDELRETDIMFVALKNNLENLEEVNKKYNKKR